MSLGTVVQKVDLDNLAGRLAREVDTDLTQVQQLKAWMDTQTDAQLLALGYVQSEVNTLRSAVGDLDFLRQVYQGVVAESPTHGGVYDFRTFAKLLSGINVH